MQNLKKVLAGLPSSPGVYKFYDAGDNLLYVGKSVDIRKRVSSYFYNKDLGPKTNLLVSKIAGIKFVKVFSEFEALLLESDQIRENQPFFNTIAKDDKSPIYIKITSDPVPLITLVRKPKKEKGAFVKGPFPNAKATKLILKRIRRIFPYCQHKNPRKPCLYVHLGLCPYPYANEDTRQEYLKNIHKIKNLLSAKNRYLKKLLTTEMKNFSKVQKFEEAARVKRQLINLQYLTETYHNPQEFLSSPNLVDDQTADRLKSLQEVLGLVNPPLRIECYDISNFQGKYATGSMVVATNGQIDKSQCRRFKIKLLSTPNDFLMLEQVLKRRFKNDWPLPDLIIIDGGKGQLSVSKKIIDKMKIKTTIVCLAKRYEEIYTTQSKEPVKLPVSSPARQLVQAIRDEAHRFAITYHRKLRSLDFISK